MTGDLGGLTAERFEPMIGETFALVADDSLRLEVTLQAVRRSGPAREGDRPFAVEFLGPLSPSLPQGIYRFEHARLGEFDIFIVPISEDAAGMHYEAVFN